MISWIPLSKKRLRQRGYDQARLIAEEISSKTGLPCRQLLQKVKNNGAQSLTRDAKQRRENVAGVYAMCGQTDVSGLRILLVDDVVTTGATMSEAAGSCARQAQKRFMALLLRGMKISIIG